MTPATGPAAVTDDVRTAFDRYLSRADETAATALVLDLLAQGADAEELLLDLIAPAQVAVGARWVANEWTVAREHAATHVSERAISALAAATRAVRDGRGTVVMVCPDGEWHSLSARTSRRGAAAARLQRALPRRIRAHRTSGLLPAPA